MSINSEKLVKTLVIALFKIISTFYPYSLSIKLHRIKEKIYKYWLFSSFKEIGIKTQLNYPISFRGGKYISIGKNSCIGARGIITAYDEHNGFLYTPEITIGDNTWIGENCHITSVNRIRIGNYVLIGKHVTITDNAHGRCEYIDLQKPPKERTVYSKGPVIIEDNVWIGDKVTILPGVKIGRNAIIGANSVVTKDVGQNCVVGGNPANVIKVIGN